MKKKSFFESFDDNIHVMSVKVRLFIVASRLFVIILNNLRQNYFVIFFYHLRTYRRDLSAINRKGIVYNIAINFRGTIKIVFAPRNDL